MIKTNKLTKIIIFILLASLFILSLAACGKESAANVDNNEVEAIEADAQNETGVANPWKASNHDEILNSLGFYMVAPAGSSDESYMINESEGIGQMEFNYGEPTNRFIYRMKKASEFTDISGLFYNWEVEDETTIGWCDGVVKRAFEGDKTIDVCLWYDAEPEVMYSISTEAEDLDGFDITAVAMQVFAPDVDETGIFMPANFLEERVERDIFDSYDEIISLLDKGNAYATIKIYGADDETLVIAESAYDNLDGNMASIEASVYRNVDGVVKNVGNIYSQGTAYPISLDSEGRVYSGGNHEVSIECLSKETGAVMSMVYAYETFDEKGNASYGGFVRDTNSLENNGEDIANDDASVLEALYKEFGNATPINYTVVE